MPLGQISCREPISGRFVEENRFRFETPFPDPFPYREPIVKSTAGNRLNHGVGFCSDDSDTPFLAVALAVLGLLELSLALGLGGNRVRR